MGQSSSKYHDPANSTISATTNAVAGASTDPQPVPPVDVDARISDAPGSRRSSVRKSILKFVKPSSIRNRLSGTPVSPSDTKRSWRSSRRWSKAPIDAATGPLESVPTASSTTSLTAGPSEISSSPVDKGKQREMDSSLEEVETNDAIVTDLDEAAQLSCSPVLPDHHSTTTITAVETSHTSELDVDPQSSINNAPFLEVDETGSATLNPSPIYEWEGSETIPAEPVLPSEPLPPSPPQQLPAFQPRQFPPPGTLVVVQGIVHTTDVSRNNTQPPSSNSPLDGSASTPATPAAHSIPGADFAQENRARNRLSTLLRRTASSRPPSVGGPITQLEADDLPFALSGSQSSSEDFTQTASTTPALSEPNSPHEDLQRPIQPPMPTPPPVAENRVPAISSSSIDVLGTLLSVAAAATAASLLTGSSEPILSSGLAPPNPTPPVTADPIFNPSSSTPSFPSYPRPATPIPDISAAGRAERMRQAWGTIRERLGLRPSVATPPGAASRTPFQQDGNVDALSTRPNGDPIPSGPSTDTRELMLAEMARAFNIGLGLNGLGGLAPNNVAQSGQSGTDMAGGTIEPSDGNGSATESSENDPSPQSQSRAAAPGMTLPPEGSFERFLVDLQIDLRTALTQAEDEPVATRVQASTPQIPQMRTQVPATMPITPVAAGQTASTAASSSSAVHTNPDLPLRDNAESQQSDLNGDDLVLEASNVDEDIYTDMPFLQEVSDSESEFDEDENNNYEEDEDEFHSADHGFTDSQSQRESTDEQRMPSGGTSRIDASGRINWWRLYRFPPIMSPRVDSAGGRTPFPDSSDPLPPSTSESTVTPDSPPTANINTSTPPPQPSTSSPPSTSPLHVDGGVPPLSQLPLHSVIPVIVVGLQSVNQEWRPDLPPQGDDGIDIFGHPPSDEIHLNHAPHEHGDDDDLDGWGGQQQGTSGLDGARGRGRGRGWHSRAANAIRNLRPGRRTTETTAGVPIPIIAPGSRTFLIYVIGGYYPPDHSIVTGGPNILDSFEALLELADLLGQVKPPTVSKDDIDKSGLEIIKAAELVQHEKDGKVSSNCLDRCLICLDDYEPEDPIRVMSCRHAFHKICVDEWLQKGRNNCPACRSTGVTTDSRSSATMPIPTS